VLLRPTAKAYVCKQSQQPRLVSLPISGTNKWTQDEEDIDYASGKTREECAAYCDALPACTVFVWGRTQEANICYRKKMHSRNTAAAADPTHYYDDVCGTPKTTSPENNPDDCQWKTDGHYGGYDFCYVLAPQKDVMCAAGLHNVMPADRHSRKMFSRYFRESRE